MKKSQDAGFKKNLFTLQEKNVGLVAKVLGDEKKAERAINALWALSEKEVVLKDGAAVVSAIVFLGGVLLSIALKPEIFPEPRNLFAGALAASASFNSTLVIYAAARDLWERHSLDKGQCNIGNGFQFTKDSPKDRRVYDTAQRKIFSLIKRLQEMPVNQPG